MIILFIFSTFTVFFNLYNSHKHQTCWTPQTHLITNVRTFKLTNVRTFKLSQHVAQIEDSSHGSILTVPLWVTSLLKNF